MSGRAFVVSGGCVVSAGSGSGGRTLIVSLRIESAVVRTTGAAGGRGRCCAGAGGGVGVAVGAGAGGSVTLPVRVVPTWRNSTG